MSFERILALLKHCFHIRLLDLNINTLHSGPDAWALCAIHNFISIHNPGKEESEMVELKEQYSNRLMLAMMLCTASDFKRAPTMPLWQEWGTEVRVEMWTSYQEILQSREGEIVELIQIQRIDSMNTCQVDMIGTYKLISFWFVSVEQ